MNCSGLNMVPAPTTVAMTTTPLPTTSTASSVAMTTTHVASTRRLTTPTTPFVSTRGSVCVVYDELYSFTSRRRSRTMIMIGSSEVILFYYTQWTAASSVVGAMTAASLCFLFGHEISRESLNEFSPDSHGRRVWLRLSSKVKGQGHQGQKPAFFGPCGGLHAVCVW